VATEMRGFNGNTKRIQIENKKKINKTKIDNSPEYSL
jgi:hypothetical protein